MNCFCNFLFRSHGSCIEMQLIFVYWLCILLLSWIHLLDQMAFLWSLLDFLHVRWYPLQTETILRLSFQFGCLLFIYFYCLMVLAWTFNTVLNRSGASEHPCLVPDLRGKAFSLPSFSNMFAVCFSYMAYVMLRHFPSIPSLLSVLSWKGVEFCQLVFCINWVGHFFPLHFLDVAYYIDRFLYTRNKFHLVVVYNSFNMLLNSFLIG